MRSASPNSRWASGRFPCAVAAYEWMKSLFTTAAHKLESLIAAKNVAKSQALIHDLGLEALNENADWLVQRRRKPVVLPK